MAASGGDKMGAGFSAEEEAEEGEGEEDDYQAALPRAALLERLRCEQMRSASLEALFANFQRECETAVEKGRRDASAAVAALAEERRLTALGLGAPMAPPGEQLSPEQPQPRPRVGVASPSPLHARKGGADAAAHSAPPLADAARAARDGVGRALALQTADSEAVLESLAALHARLQAAGAQLRRAAGALRASAQTRGSAQGEAARLCAELQVALAQLGSERERSALLSETCEKLIRGATAARAPSGRPRAQARPQPAQIAAAEAPALGAAVEAARAPGEPLALSAQPMAQRGPTASGRAFGSISE